jgi:hypothetical protein
MLERGIREILRKTGVDKAVDKAAADTLLERFYENPVIHALFAGDYKKGGANLPSYVPPERFVDAVLLLAQQPSADAAPNAFANLKALAETLVGNRTLAEGESFAAKLRDELTQHFNESMNRVSGWFARYTRRCLLIIGFALALGANVDTIQIVQTLSLDPTLADKIADAAASQFKDMQSDVTATAGDGSNGVKPEQLVEQQVQLVKSQMGLARTLSLPIGWTRSDFEQTFAPAAAPPGTGLPAALSSAMSDVLSRAAFWKKLFGLAVTAVALSLGAPLWFGILNQLVTLRTSLKPKPEKADQSGEAANAAPAGSPAV